MVIVSTEMQVKPEYRNELIALALGLLERLRGDGGCIAYEFYQRANDPHSFMFFEKWQTQEALENHLQSEHFRALQERLEPMVEGKPRQLSYQVSKTTALS
jgi:quinol monooxygenase YgiN